MRRELYLECYTGISCRKLLGALLALGAEKEELEQRLTCLAQCLVSIEAQYENQGIEEVVLRNIETAYPVFKTKEETEKKVAESPWGEKSKDCTLQTLGNQPAKRGRIFSGRSGGLAGIGNPGI